MKHLLVAIRKLKPTAEFVITDNDYSTIVWHQLEGKAPTQEEIDEAIEQIEADEIAEAKAKAQAKAQAEAKLLALGLSTNDLTALGLAQSL